jgi:hypothetical protein
VNALPVYTAGIAANASSDPPRASPRRKSAPRIPADAGSPAQQHDGSSSDGSRDSTVGADGRRRRSSAGSSSSSQAAAAAASSSTSSSSNARRHHRGKTTGGSTAPSSSSSDATNKLLAFMSVTNSGSISTLPVGQHGAEVHQEEESQSPTHRPCGIEGCSNKDVYRYELYFSAAAATL